MDQPPKSWSIHTRREIITKYQILERVGSGAYSDVYKARRLSDSVIVALKEVHDYQSAFREIEALQTLQHSPNVVVLHEYFWREDEDAVLVLEFLQTDLASVIREAKKEGKGGLSVGEIKRWIIQILCGVDACHRSSIVHRDLKPSNLLVSADGVLKLADFGQARILLESGDVFADDNPNEEEIHDASILVEPLEIIPQKEKAFEQGEEDLERGFLHEKDHDGQLEEIRAKDSYDEVDRVFNIHDANTSCVATCNNSELEDDLPRSSYSYEGQECVNDRYGQLTSYVGTRWFRAPELLYGSTSYGPEIDLWSLGCIFSELFSLEPIFPGTSDIDQLSRIFNVLGNLTEEAWPSCTKLPDYQIISFGKVENPTGIEACLPNRSPDEISLIKKLLSFDPASRATAMELLHEKYLNEEPLAVPLSQLRVPSSISAQDEGSSGEWGGNHRDGGSDSDSDFEEFGSSKYTKTDAGFSIQFL